MKAGWMEPLPVRTVPHLLLGAISEGGLMIASAEDAEKARREVASVLERLLDGLRRQHAK